MRKYTPIYMVDYAYYYSIWAIDNIIVISLPALALLRGVQTFITEVDDPTPIPIPLFCMSRLKVWEDRNPRMKMNKYFCPL